MCSWLWHVHHNISHSACAGWQAICDSMLTPVPITLPVLLINPDIQSLHLDKHMAS